MSCSPQGQLQQVERELAAKGEELRVFQQAKSDQIGQLEVSTLLPLLGLNVQCYVTGGAAGGSERAGCQGRGAARGSERAGCQSSRAVCLPASQE